MNINAAACEEKLNLREGANNFLQCRKERGEKQDYFESCFSTFPPLDRMPAEP